MRKTFTLASIILASVLHAQNSQLLACSLTITGDTCEASNGNILAANFSGASVLDTLKWYVNGALQTVKSRGTFKDTGFIVAGGSQGSGAKQFNYPSDLFVDDSGYIYVADFFNSRIQRWATGGTTGKTVAGGNGNGSNLNQLSEPRGVYVDSAGNIYVAEAGNGRISRWAPNASSGVVVAGENYKVGGVFIQPVDIWVKGNTMYIADVAVVGGRIIKWIIGDTTGTVIPGSNLPGLYYVHSVCVDKNGNIYGSYYSDVYKFIPGASSGVLVAGGNGIGINSNQINDGSGIFVDAAGNNIYVAERGGNRISKWPVNGSYGVTLAGDEGAGSALYQFDFVNYASVFVGKNGYLYVLDDYNQRILLFPPSSPVSIEKFYRTKPGSPRYQKNISATAISNTSCTISNNGLIITPPLDPLSLTISGAGYLPCGQSKYYSISKVTGAVSYQWINPAGTTILSGQGAYKIKLQSDNLNSGDLKVSILNSCGLYGKSAVLSGLRSTPPRPKNFSGPSAVSSNQQGVPYSVTNTTEVTNYVWSVPAGAAVATGQGTNSITVNFGTSSGNVSVTANNICGSSVPRSQLVTVNGLASPVRTFAGVHNLQVSIYPNPIHNYLSISLQNNSSSNITVSISDISGKKIGAKNFNVLPGNFKTEYDMSGYAPGLYLVTVKTDQGNETFKVIKE